MKRFCFIVCLAFFISSAFPVFGETENYLSHTVRAVILVDNPDAAADRIAEWVQKNEGYYVLKATDMVIIRFPMKTMGTFRTFLEKTAAHLIHFSPEAVDLREEILGLQSGIRSREEILKKNLSFIDQADVEGTLSIEKEITQLIIEIEQLSGKLKKLNTDKFYARAEITLNYMQQTLPEKIPSSFNWINSVDFYSFINEAYK